MSDPGRNRPATPATYRRRRWLAAAAVAALVFGVSQLAGVGGDEPAGGPRAASPSEVDSGDASAPPTVERLQVGRGARGATVVRPEGAIGGATVILLHGWQLGDAKGYRRWASHLARRGRTVILPRYQESDTPPDRVLDNAVAGVRRALQLSGSPSPLIVAGHSAGAALAADYAAVAAGAGLPTPVAVLAIYPGRAILGYPGGIPTTDLAQIDASTRLIVMASPLDAVVGEQPAQELVAGATQVPASRKRLVSVSDPKAADHYAPAGDGKAARRTFWTTLDRLIERYQPAL